MSIIENLGECELLCQLAEEASELAQAALKLRRALDGTNPTPKSVQECRDDLTEEIADCQLLLSVLDLDSDDYIKKYYDIIRMKTKRWARRLREAKHG